MSVLITFIRWYGSRRESERKSRGSSYDKFSLKSIARVSILLLTDPLSIEKPAQEVVRRKT